VVFPKGKIAGALLTTLATLQLSDVIGVPRLTLIAVASQSELADIVTVEGQVMVGSILSSTVTI
jgi:hypothetical protein